MAKNAATHPSPAPSPANRPADSGPALASVIEINIRHIGRTPQPEKLTGSEAPEGWIKKIDRPREGKVWVGFFHLYVADPSGRAVRSFCPQCGNPVMKRSSGHPDLLFLHAATLDDPAQFKADRVVWSASRPPWDHIDPDLPCD